MKNLFSSISILVSSFVVSIGVTGSSFAAISPGARLTLEEYMSQVKENNLGVKGAIQASQGAELRSHEAELLLAPTVFLDGRYSSDARLQPFSLLSFDSLLTRSLSFGVQKTTTFGLQARLHYDLLYTNYLNAVSVFNIPGMGALAFPTSYTNASPVLELTQSLWGNTFGRSTRAHQEQIEAQALASQYGNSFKAKMAMVQAEASYWRLALGRQAVAVQKEALERAKLIHQWNVRRANLHLGDQSDVLQAEALVKSRELELMAARNEERSASRAFNSTRHTDSDQVPERLIEISPDQVDKLKIPVRAEVRDDVKSAQQAAKASQAVSIQSLERDSPTLELFGSIASNGQRGSSPFADLGEAMANSFSFNRPSYAVGIRFSAPIDLEVTHNSREGWRKESIAAELEYEQKVFEQEQSWKDLNETLVEARSNLDLSRKLESIQEAKLSNERDRLKRGRSTTYQVLLFEQDYLMSQLLRIRNQAHVLNIIAQMKLFGEAI